MKEAKVTFSQIIRQLAEKYHSISFQPHITLAGVPDWPEYEMIQAIQKIAVGTSPFELVAKKVHCKSSPYQKITLEVEKSGDLNALHKKTDTLFSGDFSKKEYPHISLLYSSLRCKDLQQQMADIEIDLPHKICLNRIALVHCKGTAEDWRTLYMCGLD